MNSPLVSGSSAIESPGSSSDWGVLSLFGLSDPFAGPKAPHAYGALSRRMDRSVCLDRPRQGTQNRSMSSSEIDAYLAGLEEPKRSTLQQLRHTILEVIPEAEEGISYQVPAFRLHGKVVAGFAAFKNHLSYLPHSGSVFPQLQKEVASYRTSSGALQFPIDKPLPKPLVEKMVRVRI